MNDDEYCSNMCLWSGPFFLSMCLQYICIATFPGCIGYSICLLVLFPSSLVVVSGQSSGCFITMFAVAIAVAIVFCPVLPQWLLVLFRCVCCFVCYAATSKSAQYGMNCFSQLRINRRCRFTFISCHQLIMKRHYAQSWIISKRLSIIDLRACWVFLIHLFAIWW